MEGFFSRTELLLGSGALNKLNSKKISIFGLGGVGSFVVEGLVRSGISKFVLVDDDFICKSNINRQIHAEVGTIGRAKVQLMKERILKINPKSKVVIYQKLYNSDTADELIHRDSDYIVDAIDSIACKVNLIVKAKEMGIPIISSMGAGNKLDPTKFKIGDIYNTSVDPLARRMRKDLRQKGVDSLKVVYSTEKAISIKDKIRCENLSDKAEIKAGYVSKTIGSVAWVPSVVGMIIAGELIQDLIKS